MTSLKTSISLILLCLLLFTVGCGRGGMMAQISLDQGMNSNSDIRTAFFIKSWGLNRALITEARDKWVAMASMQILKSQQEGKISAEHVKAIMQKLQKELGADEVVASENFAYLAFLLSAGERSDQYIEQVDIYLESNKPIWKHLSVQAEANYDDLKNEWETWKPLIRDIQKIVPKSWYKKK